MVGIAGNSPNAAMSSRKDRVRSNLSEQVRQIRDPPGIKMLHRLDESASRSSSAKGSLNHWNFSTVRSHDIGLVRPPPAELFFHQNLLSLVWMVIRALSSLG